MIIPPDYLTAEKQARLDNAELLRANLTSDEVARKISSWAERFGMEPEFVRYKLLIDDTFAMNFVKDPGRQSLHQKVAAEHIRSNLPLVQGFATPPAGGQRALYVVRGLVVSGESLHPATSNHGKSIDFRWGYSREGRSLQVYATHKHTKEEGGSQDNQFADVKRFLDEARSGRDPNVLFLAICDGAYYLRPHDGRSTRLDTLVEDYRGPRLAACAIEGLPKVWAYAVEQWLVDNRLALLPEEEAALRQLRE